MRRAANIAMRTTAQEKQSLQYAAELAGYSNLTNFMMTVARREANRILSDMQTTYLTGKDWDSLTDALAHPPPPNEALTRLLSDDQPSEPV